MLSFWDITLDIELQEGAEISPISVGYVRQQRNSSVILCRSEGPQDNWVIVVLVFLPFYN